MPIASGANSVASALGNRRRDPGTAMRTYHEGLKPTRKTGTFYFGGNRNFLLWSDTGGLGGRRLQVVNGYNAVYGRM